MPDDQTHLLVEVRLDQTPYLAPLLQPVAVVVVAICQMALVEVVALVAAVVFQPFKNPADQATPQALLLHRATRAALAFPRQTTAQVGMAAAAVPLRQVGMVAAPFMEMAALVLPRQFLEHLQPMLAAAVVEFI